MAIKVKALELGFYGGKLRREGTVFEVEVEEHLGKWMEKVGKELTGRAAKKKADLEPAEEGASDESVI